MIWNYFKIAWRNLVKHKVFSLINIVGMSTAMVICIFMLTKIKEFYDYDNFHPDAANTYRIITGVKKPNGEFAHEASSPLPLGPYLKNNYSQVESFTRVCFQENAIKSDSKTFQVKTAFTDPGFYKIFGFKISSGSPALAPGSVVLSQDLATKFFGKNDPVGKTLTLGNYGLYSISGVLEKNKYPSHLKFDALVSLHFTNSNFAMDDWSADAEGYTYVHIKNGTGKSSISSFLKSIDASVNEKFLKNVNKRLSFEAQSLSSIVPALRPLSHAADEPPFSTILLLSSIAGIILSLSFFNYINLTLARSLDRAREIGVRKISGALRSNLVHQLLIESVLLTLIAFALALVEFNLLKSLPAIWNPIADVVQDGTLWLFFAVFAIAAGLVAGWIPAKVLSGFKPIDVLKGKLTTRLFGGIRLRKLLTITQFSASLIALVVLVIFFKQNTFMAHADYGFAKDKIINLPLHGQEYHLLSSSMLSIPGVETVSGTSAPFGNSEYDHRFLKRNPESDSINASYFSVSPSFISAMKLNFVAGKNIPEQTGNVQNKFIVLNEEACRVLKFKYPAESIGQLIYFNNSAPLQIAGIVKDFNFQNFHHRIGPLILINRPAEFNTLLIKATSGETQSVFSKIEKQWKTFNPYSPVAIHWYDRDLYYQNLQEDDLVFIGLLTGISLLIACLGLLGMVMYSAKRREKEVSIRRVLGAGFRQLVYAISKEFILLLAISVAIGLPVGALFGKQFLQQYSYQVPINISLLAGCALVVLVVGSLMIGWQAIRTVVINPVKSLRME